MHAINFLTAVSRSVHYKLFEGADTLRQICESIVIPNLRMREDMVRGCACCAASRGRWGVSGSTILWGGGTALAGGMPHAAPTACGHVPPPHACTLTLPALLPAHRCLQEEMFEMNWIEYVRRDTEGSDSDTRRRAASELVKSLTDRFPQQVGSGRRWRVVCLGRCVRPC